MEKNLLSTPATSTTPKAAERPIEVSELLSKISGLLWSHPRYKHFRVRFKQTEHVHEYYSGRTGAKAELRIRFVEVESGLSYLEPALILTKTGDRGDRMDVSEDERMAASVSMSIVLDMARIMDENKSE